MVTLKMIAEETGLSVAAVSKALNHLPGISEENARRVRQVARKMDYYPNGAAQTLKTNHSYNIGVVYQNKMAHEHFAVVLEGIRATLEEKGYDLTFLGNKGVREMGYYAHAMRRNCDGIIIAAGTLDPDGLRKAAEGKLPVVGIDHAFPNRTVVCNADEQSMHEVVRYVFEHGHRRIAFIHGQDGRVTRRRLKGFRDACSSLGLEVPDEYVCTGFYQKPDDTGIMVQKLMSLPKPPTCILFPDDISYLGGMLELEREGLGIPDDVSCVGYDGIRLSSLLRPQLTTYAQDAWEIGRTAALELVKAIDSPDSYEAHSVVIPGRLQEGGTVRDLRT